MKKVVSLLILFVVAISLTTVVSATTASELADELYSMGEPYGVPESWKVKIERYVADNEVTDEQAEQIMAKAEEALQVLKDAGVNNYDELTDAQKNKVKSIANEAADILGLTLTIKKGTVEIYKDGKLIDTITEPPYTGNNVNVVLVVSSVAVVALAAAFVARKKFANA